jgi:uncharacterized integral membrane protein
MRTFLRAIVLVPIAIIAIAFAVANRHSVTISLDPFSAGEPAYALSGPLFLVIFVLLMAGIVIGGIATWLGQVRYRKAARRAQAEIDESRAENDRLRTEIDILTRRARESRDNVPALALPDLS